VGKLPYKEGTWFAIPLRKGGYAAGLVARLIPGQGKIILAYLFGPKREAIPSIGELGRLSPDMAIKIARIGDLALIDGSWPIIGEAADWRREKWPTPAFIRRDDIGRIAWQVEYSDENPNQVVAERRVPYETAGFEKDGLLGAGAAEIVLTKLLP
jgi:hypothetical protein